MESDQGVLLYVVSLRPAVDAGESSQYPSSQPTDRSHVCSINWPRTSSLSRTLNQFCSWVMADFHPSIPGVSRHASLPVFLEGANGCRP